MMKDNATYEQEPQKKISISVDPSVEKPKLYDLFLVKTAEDFLEIQLAKLDERDDEVQVSVDTAFRIPADDMIDFAGDIVKALVEYEKEFKNGKGLKSDAHD